MWNPHGRFVEGELLDPSNSKHPDDAPLDWRAYRKVYAAAFSEAQRSPEADCGEIYVNLVVSNHANVPVLREGEPQFWETVAVCSHAARDAR
jgi:hypothetical protein